MDTKNKTTKQKMSFIEQARRTQILQHAIETIAELGYAQASVGQIAKHAGISKGVITYHFASKDELMDQIVTEVYAAAARFMEPRIERETTPAGMFRVYIESNLAFMEAQRSHIVAVTEIVANARTEDGKLRYAGASDESILEPVIEILKWGQETGDFKPFSDFALRVTAMSIRSSIDGVAYRLAAASSLDVRGFAQELAVLYLSAILKPSLEAKPDEKG
ncbi:TetR/AcrR family transcriptional regulator [Paenibacillus macerans]|uniref:TetR/AcrR family transcriptional regulator n=1 Tax=Paenibacillus macerans TaxID=44252 RepID=UPI002E241636|nr:TetR/AcrR family transcriptional regulator [Paenibacillus macerans]